MEHKQELQEDGSVKRTPWYRSKSVDKVIAILDKGVTDS